MSRDDSPAGASHHADRASAVLEVDAAALARTLREQRALPLTDAEAETLARSLEASGSDEELLANTLTAMRLLVNRLEPLT